MYNILICDDDRDIVNALKIYLSHPDYVLFTAFDGAEALEICKKNEIHLVLLDIMMPKMDGITAMAKIREDHNMPVILLTAKGEDYDKVLGLNVGADDYITKPFNPLEVAARVNSQIRRYTCLGSQQKKPESLMIDGIELDDTGKEVKVDGKSVSLTPKEFDILKLLMSSSDKVFSPREIYLEVWKENPMQSDANTVAVHIRHLREKIEFDPNEPRHIKVVFGQGYKFEKGRKR